MKDMLDRFIRYAETDTGSSEDSETFPSTPGQMRLLSILADELREMGLSTDFDREKGYVYAFLPASPGYEEFPPLGFISHVDTSPDAPGKDVRPRLIEAYDGNDILLGSDAQGREIVLRVSEFPQIAEFKGKSIIVTDGSTLLGADDKAGVAEIMEAVSLLSGHGNADNTCSGTDKIPHGKVCVAFTPDEELGLGASGFDLERFGAKYAYTVDGGAFPEFEYGNFNAAGIKVLFTGKNIHPGSAKGVMKNALSMAVALDNMLPDGERPEKSEGREGFFHLTDLHGDVSRAVSEYLIRDGDSERFQERKKLFLNACEYINRLYGPGSAHVEMKDTYYNMEPLILEHPHLIGYAKKAFEMTGSEMVSKFIRGGTDGATLSYMGLPCPNLPTGGINFHSVYECACLDDMVRVRDVIINLVKLYAEGKED